MIGLSIFLSCLFTWLLYETDWMRVKLTTTEYLRSLEMPGLTHSELYNLAYRIGWEYKGYADKVEHLSPLCGWQWIAKHEHDLDDYNPSVSISFDGFSATMQIKDLSIIKGLVKTITKDYKPHKSKRRKYIDLERVPA